MEEHAGKGPTEQDAVQGLINLDPAKYASMMTDLAMGGTGAGRPLWANLPFLERPSGAGGDKMDPKKRVLDEITTLKQEKRQLASELEKAQNLVRL